MGSKGRITETQSERGFGREDARARSMNEPEGSPKSGEEDARRAREDLGAPLREWGWQWLPPMGYGRPTPYELRASGKANPERLGAMERLEEPW